MTPPSAIFLEWRSVFLAMFKRYTDVIARYYGSEKNLDVLLDLHLILIGPPRP